MPTVRFASPNVVNFSEGDGYIRGTILLSEPSTKLVTLTVAGPAYSTNDIDISQQTITFEPGETSKLFQTAIYDDSAVEGNEAFLFYIVNPINADGLPVNNGGGLRGFIVDNDTGPLLNAQVSISAPAPRPEGDSGELLLEFEVRAVNPSLNYVPIEYDLSIARRYVTWGDGPRNPLLSNGHLVFGPGDTTKTVKVAVTADTSYAPDTPVTVTLRTFQPGAVLTVASATTTILNDDFYVSPIIEAAFTNILKVAPAAADLDFVAGLSGNVAGGGVSQTQAFIEIANKADATTSVATLAYQFFTGKIPSEAGLAYLVSPTGPNPNNLNSAYYQSFNLENRYINFAVNLGKNGDGKLAFEQAYGSKNLTETVKAAYGTIFGLPPTDAKVAALLAGGRDAYFASYGLDGLSGIGTKAAAVGWLLAEAAKADLGMYAKAGNAFLVDLADGTTNFGVNLIGVYGKPEFAI